MAAASSKSLRCEAASIVGHEHHRAAAPADFQVWMMAHGFRQWRNRLGKIHRLHIVRKAPVKHHALCPGRRQPADSCCNLRLMVSSSSNMANPVNIGPSHPRTQPQNPGTSHEKNDAPTRKPGGGSRRIRAGVEPRSRSGGLLHELPIPCWYNCGTRIPPPCGEWSQPVKPLEPSESRKGLENSTSLLGVRRNSRGDPMNPPDTRGR